MLKNNWKELPGAAPCQIGLESALMKEYEQHEQKTTDYIQKIHLESGVEIRNSQLGANGT